MSEAGPIKVTFLLDCLYGEGRGGTETQFLRCYQEFPGLGILADVIFLRDREFHHSVEWRSPPLTLALNSLRSPRLFSSVMRVLRRMDNSGSTHLHTFFDDAAIVGALACMVRPRIHLICSQRNLGHQRSRFSHWLFGHVFRVADQVAVNSHGIRHELSVRYPAIEEKVRVIDNLPDIAVDAASAGTGTPVGWPEVEAGSLIVLIVANLRPVKGIDDILDAAAMLAPRPKLYFVIAGDGALDQYRNRARKMGLADQIHFLGFRDDVPELLHMADIAMLPSRAEGASNALMEYMLKGLPVIATNVGGNSDFLAHGEAGLLVEPGEPAALASAVKKLAGSSELRSELGRAARVLAQKRFSRQHVLEAMRALYQNPVIDRCADN